MWKEPNHEEKGLYKPFWLIRYLPLLSTGRHDQRKNVWVPNAGRTLFSVKHDSSETMDQEHHFVIVDFKKVLLVRAFLPLASSPTYTS